MFGPPFRIELALPEEEEAEEDGEDRERDKKSSGPIQSISVSVCCLLPMNEAFRRG